MSDAALTGAGVLVTRPRHQSAELVSAIEHDGGTAYLLPCIDIVARDPDAVRRELASLPAADVSIFISRNAVEHGLEFADGELAAIGPTTAAAIRGHGRTVAIMPETGFDSESLLAEPALRDVRGKAIRIIRGNAGRETLGTALAERGARVDYVSAYERRLPVHPRQVLDELDARWQRGEIDAVVAMSVESYRNLTALLPEFSRRQLASTPLVTPSERVLKEALTQYPGCPVSLSDGPQAVDVVRGIAAALAHRQAATARPD